MKRPLDFDRTTISIIDANGHDIADCALEGEARELIAAYNAHDDLVAALRDFVECHANGGFVQVDDDVLDAARKALGKA